MSSTYSITITNSQSVATPSPFQQMLVLNLSSLITSASQLLNLKFCSDSSCTSQLYAWIESYNSNFSEVVIWVNLPNGVPANGSVTIYVTLASSNQYPYTGMNPLLTSTYGQYDNGNNVFTFYDNFAGTSLNTNKWVNNTSNSNNSFTVNNGITITPGSNVYFHPTIYSVQSFSEGVYEAYGTMDSSSPGTSAAVASIGLLYPPAGSQNHALVGWFNGIYGLSTSNSSGASNNVSGLSAGTHIWQIFIPSSSPSVIYASQDYGSQIESTSDMPTLPQPFGFVNQQNYGANITFYWVRARAYPPNGVMPSISSSLAYTPPSISTEAFYVQLPTPPTSTEAFYVQLLKQTQPTSTEAFYVQPQKISISTSTEAFYIQSQSIFIPTSTEAFYVQQLVSLLPTSTEAFYIQPVQVTTIHVTIPEFLMFLSIPQGIYADVNISPSVNITFGESPNYITSFQMNVTVVSSNVTPVSVTQKTPFEFQLISGFLATSLILGFARSLVRKRRKKK